MGGGEKKRRDDTTAARRRRRRRISCWELYFAVGCQNVVLTLDNLALQFGEFFIHIFQRSFEVRFGFSNIRCQFRENKNPRIFCMSLSRTKKTASHNKTINCISYLGKMQPGRRNGSCTSNCVIVFWFLLITSYVRTYVPCSALEVGVGKCNN